MTTCSFGGSSSFDWRARSLLAPGVRGNLSQSAFRVVVATSPALLPPDGTPDVLNPRGSGYYAVVVIELAPHSKLYKNFNLRTVIPCKEQLRNRYTSEIVEAWPLDALTIAPASSTASSHLGTIPEGVGRRNGGPGG